MKGLPMAMDEVVPDYAELVGFMVREMVGQPQSVAVEEERDGHRVTVRIRTAPEDLGKLIGRGGRHIEAIRMVVRAASLRPRDRVYLEVRD
ncbi:MAG TPA: KH domain-containing protein [Candidatus Dormibacteraeota bacterium]|nr:KH domain-containing protein [Candidatus Dormibacteraeota bacterium]